MNQFRIVHDIPGRMRIRTGKYSFTETQASALELAILQWQFIYSVKANYKSGSILFQYDSAFREELILKINEIDFVHFDASPYLEKIQELNESSYALQQKEVNQEYIHRFKCMIVRRYFVKWFIPLPIRNLLRIYNALGYVKKGLSSLFKGKVDVPVLDATSICVSILNKEYETAGNIMFLLSVSDLLEDYTKKKTSLQLKESLAYNVDHLFVLKDGIEKQIPAIELKKGDIVIVQTGSMISVDGEVVDGEGMINESSFTGEPLSKAVKTGSSVFAGTVVEEGKIYIRVRNLQNESRINRIVDMIDSNEELKASIQANAEHLADSIVPFSFIGFFGLWALTRNLTRATSILLVDYSCAIKLSTSISIISAMQQAGKQSIMVKGGKYLEAMANADTIVFDKTGTLTNATPIVQKVIPLGGYTRNEILKTAACLEEHFPHSVAKAIVKKAFEENLNHAEEHTKVEYIIAHGLASTLDNEKAVIGSAHFVFEDEGIPYTKEIQDIEEEEFSGGANSIIYLGLGGKCVGLISIYDALKSESKEVVQNLRDAGFKTIVMLTGDCENAARHVAEELKIDMYKSQVLPEDKAEFVKELKAQGKVVVMVGDGVNDTPALSCSDVSISMQDSSDIARELADVTLLSSNLQEIVKFKKLSQETIKRIHTNYRYIVGFNSGLIILGALGVIVPSTSALFHNASTFVFGLNSLKEYSI